MKSKSFIEKKFRKLSQIILNEKLARSTLVILVSSVSISVNAKTVIYDDYQSTKPANRYYDATIPIELDAESIVKTVNPKDYKNPKPTMTRREYYSMLLPLAPTTMRPGELEENRRVNIQNLFHPICVVGSDEMSINWVEENYDLLLNKGTVCFVVEAKTDDDLDEIFAELNEIQTVLGNGDALSNALNLDTYPVLIDSSNITQ